MKEKTKRNLGNLFGSLISNQRAIDGSKEMPWFVAIIFLLLSAFIPVIPLMTNISSSYGSQFLKTYSYDLDTALTSAAINMRKENKEFIIKDNKLTYYVDNTPKELDTTQDLTPVGSYINSVTNQYELLIYTSSRYTTKVENNLNNLITEVNKIKYISGSTNEYVEGTEGVTTYIPHIMVLHKEVLYLATYKINTTTVVKTLSGYNYKNLSKLSSNNQLNLLEYVLTVDGKVLDDTSLIDTTNKTAVLSNWKKIFDKAYEDVKGRTLLYNTLIFIGIYFGLILFMGLMVWLLTRGKKNMFHFLKIWDCQKISYWASLSPAILALILGFVMPQFASMSFIVLEGIRIMWLSMKQLKPTY